MARIRSIKPEFWTSEQVVECSPIARLLFIGLWTFCDDGGVHPLAAMRIKMEVFPADPFTAEQILGWIQELAVAGLLKTYVVGGQRFLAITGWKHQKIESPTYRFPGPERAEQFDEHSTIALRTVVDDSAREWSGVDGSGEDVSSCGEDATTGTAKANGRPDGSTAREPVNVGDNADGAADKATGKANGEGYPALFEEFWLAYPARGGRRRGKGKCYGIWRQAIRAADRQSLVEAARAYAASDEPTRGFARDPERFLTKDWWRDWLAEPASESAPSLYPEYGK